MKTAHGRNATRGSVRRGYTSGRSRAKDWEWVERHVWTERMLEALDKGVKGGVWFSLIDKVYQSLRPLPLGRR